MKFIDTVYHYQAQPNGGEYVLYYTDNYLPTLKEIAGSSDRVNYNTHTVKMEGFVSYTVIQEDIYQSKFIKKSLRNKFEKNYAEEIQNKLLETYNSIAVNEKKKSRFFKDLPKMMKFIEALSDSVWDFLNPFLVVSQDFYKYLIRLDYFKSTGYDPDSCLSQITYIGNLDQHKTIPVFIDTESIDQYFIIGEQTSKEGFYPKIHYVYTDTQMTKNHQSSYILPNTQFKIEKFWTIAVIPENYPKVKKIIFKRSYWSRFKRFVRRIFMKN